MSSAYFSTVTLTDFLNIGRSVTGLDLNGDGFSDIVVGADQAENDSNELTGQVLVIYGSGASGDFNTSTFDIDAIGASDGFVISGAADGDEFGWDVLNAGDQNGDGRDDLAMLSRATGTITVLFSQDGDFSDIDLSAGIGAAGYEITGLGILPNDVTVSGGTDVNGDTIADLVIGVSGGGGSDTVHVVFGDATSDDIAIGALDGTNGFSVTGIQILNTGGSNTGTIGNLDGTGPDDILLGLDLDPVSTPTGDIVIMRGTATPPLGTSDINVDDLTAVAGSTITLTGLSVDVASSASVTGGFDINGDGISDVAVGVANDDTGGNNAGAVYVVFGDAAIADSVDLTTLNGSNGFEIIGLAAEDKFGLVTQALGDVSGDGRDDLGILTASGDLYVIYGIEDTASFPASLDLSALDGTNGYAIAGLFDETPETLSLAGLPNINGDGPDPINDIAIGATFDFGTSGETFVILGGAQNFQNLDDADDNANDGTIAFAQIGEVPFAVTSSIILGGDTTGELTEDGSTVTGAISVTDTEGGTPSFANRPGTGGVYGGLIVNGDGNTWTYTLNTDTATQDILQALNVGDSLFDTIDVTTDDTSATQTITIEITGLDDPAEFVEDAVPTFSEDVSQFTVGFTLTDVDNDDPSLAGLRFDGTSAYVQFNEDGTGYTVFTTDPSLQDLDNGETQQETITVTDSAGNEFGIDLTFQGATEGVAFPDATTGDDEIYTSFGDDIINALDGDDTINPGAGDDTVDGGDGDDTIVDGLGNDTVDGGNDNDSILLLTGENDVEGGDGNDFIRTGYKTDVIQGNEGNDIISADSGAFFLFGNDTVDGGTGDDLMQAGAGADTFVFRPNEGNDTIGAFDDALVVRDATGFDYSGVLSAEFEVGIDKISLVGFTTVNATNVFDFINDSTASVSGAVFDADGTTIRIVNVAEAQLSVEDFIFA